jgi:hypothetical protein
MSRSGYSDYFDASSWENIMWRGAVASAIRGKRGQAFLKEMLAQLDALPEKCLIAEELINEKGEVCAMGAVAKARGIDVSNVNPEDRGRIANLLNIPYSLVAEIAFTNDEPWFYSEESPQDRFVRVRKWIVSRIKE